jgi:allantoin racemase
MAQKLGTTKLASVRAVDIPVLELEDRAKTSEALVKQSIKAIEADNAHVIVMGCTGMAGLAKEVKDRLAKQGYNIPVLDPAFVALKMVEILVDMEASQSRLAYPRPPEKERTGGD